MGLIESGQINIKGLKVLDPERVRDLQLADSIVMDSVARYFTPDFPGNNLGKDPYCPVAEKTWQNIAIKPTAKALGINDTLFDVEYLARRINTSDVIAPVLAQMECDVLEYSRGAFKSMGFQKVLYKTIGEITGVMVRPNGDMSVLTPLFAGIYVPEYEKAYAKNSSYALACLNTYSASRKGPKDLQAIFNSWDQGKMPLQALVVRQLNLFDDLARMVRRALTIAKVPSMGFS